jgi:putative DNA primase/helicase
MQDIIQAFRQDMAENGIVTDAEIIPTGEIQRFHVDGDKRGSKNGWAILHTDGLPAGAYGSWKTGNFSWCAKDKRRLSPRERRQYCQNIEKMRQQRQAARKQQAEGSAIAAAKCWSTAQPASPNHPYLLKKGIQPNGARQFENHLLVPMVSPCGQLAGIQRIYPDGFKKFGSGTRKKGSSYQIGTPTNCILLAEGFATAATLHEVTGLCAVVCFDAGNIEPVLRGIRDHHPDKYQFPVPIICADNDDSGKGWEAACKAADIHGAGVYCPKFEPGEPGSDWNDFHQVNGRQDTGNTLYQQLADDFGLEWSQLLGVLNHA